MTFIKNLSSLFSWPVILWIAAFVCALCPINEWQLEWFMALIVVLFTWGYIMLSPGVASGWKMPRAPVLYLAGAFWMLVVCSAFWSEIKSISFTGATFFSLLPLTFFVGVMAGREDYFKTIARILAVIFAILSIWAIVQFFFLNMWFNGQARHPLADPSSLGGLFSLALFCALGWILSGRPAGERKLAVILASLLVCGIMSTLARGPIFAFIPGILVFGILLWPKVKERWKSLLVVAVVAIAFFGVMQTGIQKQFDLGQRLTGTVTMSMEDVSNNRTNLWESTIEMIKDRPFFGTGIGTYFLYYPEYRSPNDADGAFMAHNDPLQFWAELGVLGPLLFYAFVIAAAIRTFRALKNKDITAGERVVIVTVFAALVSMVTQSHVSFMHYNMSILLVTGALLSVWFLVTTRALKEPLRDIVMASNVSAKASRIVLALPFVLSGWLALSIMGGEHMANRARDALFKEEVMDFASSVNMAGRISLGLNYRVYLYAVNVPLAILDFEKDTITEEKQKELYKQTTEYMEFVLALNPRAGSAYYYLGRVQSLVAPSVIPADTPTPEEYYRKALKLDPTHLGARMALYKIYMDQGKSNAELLKYLQEGEQFTYTTVNANEFYGALTTLYLEEENYVKMKEVVARLAEFQKRSDYSYRKRHTSMPQAILEGSDMFEIE